MPEVTASTKIVLGSIAAAAALITGLLGNVLAANISAFFSGTPPKTGKRPAMLWLAFFVSASLSVVAGSITTFAPTAPATPGAGDRVPKIVVTNVNGSKQYADPKYLIVICRDMVELANTSDIPTSVVAVGTDLTIDGTLVKIAPTEYGSRKSANQVQIAVSPWRVAPPTKEYTRVRSLDQFQAVQGETLPIRSNARSTTTVYLDYALKFTTALPQKISAAHLLRFPDIEDIETEAVVCR